MIPLVLPLVMQGLSALAPMALGLLKKKDTAAAAIEMLSATAQVITGESSDDKALEVLKNDPAKLQEYQNSVNAHAAEMYRQQTDRMEIVNETMRVESANKDWYVRRMRPTFGYALIYCFVLIFTTVTFTAVVIDIDKAIKLISAYAEMKWYFISGFSAMGIYINGRTKEKMGLSGSVGVLGGLARKLFR